VPDRIKAIPVEDANGDQLTLYEIRERVSLFGLVVRKRFELCTGEPVTRDGDIYLIASTGEKLVPLEAPD
jgi:hypothetical protein